MGPSEAEEKGTLVDEMLKSPLPSYEDFFKPGPLSLPPFSPPPVTKNVTEDAFDYTVINLLERIKSAPDNKLEPLTMALNAVVQAKDTYTYEEED